MEAGDKLRRLGEQRAALIERIRAARNSPSASITVPTMLLALEALDDLIARQTQASDDRT